ncbi:MAG: phenylalanine--tRNA ligase subunit beta [Halobacteria archaeon]
MPAINLKINRLSRFLGKEVNVGELIEAIRDLGLAVEEVSEGYIKAEYNPNRPDYSSIVGVARALQGMLGIKTGMPRYKVHDSGVKMIIDPKVSEVRPFVVSAIVKNLELNEDVIEEIIAMQEDLHWIIGRDRRKVAIGLHDYSKIKPPIYYRALPPDSISFVPLGGTQKITPIEILRNTSTGIKYGHILEGKKYFPFIMDSNNEVLSFPPIINSSLTELTYRTRDIFIDVTGTDFKAISDALNILVTALHDMGGTIYSVDLIYDNRRITTPDLSPSRWRINLKEQAALIGVDIRPIHALRALRRMRLDARLVDDEIEIYVPAYRVDILHPVDFAEEIAIGIGYSQLTPIVPYTANFGRLTALSEFSKILRILMVGLGFTEAINTTLSNGQKDYEFLGISQSNQPRILNPASIEYNTLRHLLLPGLLETLALNKHNPMPQKFFELGDVLQIDENVAEKFVRRLHLCLVISHSSASYSEIKSTEEEIARALQVEISMTAKDYPFMIPGRSVALMKDNVEVGFMGEIHPEVLEKFKIEMPTVSMEIDISLLGLI